MRKPGLIVVLVVVVGVVVGGTFVAVKQRNGSLGTFVHGRRVPGRVFDFAHGTPPAPVIGQRVPQRPIRGQRLFDEPSKDLTAWAGAEDVSSCEGGVLFGIGCSRRGFGSVSAEFTVPPLASGGSDGCNSNPTGQAGFWVGLGGDPGVDGSNTGLYQVGVVASCYYPVDASSGTLGATYRGFYETIGAFGANTPANQDPMYNGDFAIHPGDDMFASVTRIFGRQYQFVLTDKTQLGADGQPAAVISETEPCLNASQCSDESAEAIAEDPSSNNSGGLEGYAPYGTAVFSAGSDQPAGPEQEYAVSDVSGGSTTIAYPEISSAAHSGMTIIQVGVQPTPLSPTPKKVSNPSHKPSHAPPAAWPLPCQVMSAAVDAQIGQGAALTIDTPRADIDGNLEDLGIPFHTCVWSSPNPQAGLRPTEPAENYISLGVVPFLDETAAQHAFDQQEVNNNIPAVVSKYWPLSSISVPIFYVAPGPQDDFAVLEMLVGDSIVGIEANVGGTLFNTAPWLSIARVTIDELTQTGPPPATTSTRLRPFRLGRSSPRQPAGCRGRPLSGRVEVNWAVVPRQVVCLSRRPGIQ